MAIKTILVPTDFSKNATNAVNFAVKVAEKLKAKIILFHSYHTNIYTPDMPMEYVVEMNTAVREEADKQLNILAEKLRKTNKLAVDCLNLESLTVDGILDAIVKKRADMVIMGTKGASGIKEVIIGSVSAKIIEKAACPVLTIPEKATFDGLKRITYASDYHTSDITILKKVIEIAKFFKSKITVLHVSISENTHEVENELLKKFIYKVGQKIDYKNVSYQILYSNDEAKALEKYLNNKSTDLLVMSTRYRTLLEKFFTRSITKKLSYHTKVPLLAYHYKKTSFIFI